jgi:hypothetical protein
MANTETTRSEIATSDQGVARLSYTSTFGPVAPAEWGALANADLSEVARAPRYGAALVFVTFPDDAGFGKPA